MNASTNLYCDFEANIIEGRGLGMQCLKARCIAQLCPSALYFAFRSHEPDGPTSKKMEKC